MTRVLVLSDLHLTATPAGKVRGVATCAGLDIALAHARAAGPWDHVVLTGDLAEEPGPASYGLLRQRLGDWADRALLLAGNHDRIAPLRAVFARPPGDAPPGGRVGFVAQSGGWRLVGVDSHWHGHVRGRLGEVQLRWLMQVLSADAQPAVLFVHHPPLKLGSAWLDVTRLADADALAALLARSGRVRLVVHGHAHMASERRLGATPVLGVPSTAFQFMPGSLLPRRGPAIPGYRALDLGELGFRTQITYP